MLFWIKENSIEVIGALFAFGYLWLEIKERWQMWIVGSISSAFYVYIFFKSGVYAQMGLNIYFFFINLYGLYCWRFSAGKNSKPLIISRINFKLGLLLALIALILFVLIGILLKSSTDSPVPFPDAFAASLSIVATWMVARKFIEHWFVWMIVNFFSIGLYYYLELYPTAVLYLIYTLMSFVGYAKWRQSLLKQKQI